MIINIILAILLAASIAFIGVLLKKQKQFRSLEQGVEFFIQRDMKGFDIPQGQGEVLDLTRRLLEAMKELALLFQGFEENNSKSERASTRLSRNIQKALLYTTDIGQLTFSNRETSSQLFQLVAEGSAAVEEIHASITSLKDQMLTQNREIEQTSQAMKNIGESLTMVSEISSKRLQDTQNLVDLTAVGNQKITETDKVIHMVQDKVDDVLTLITVINKIASQTNLLSMNAAIEAAHAGDAGRGFAVVAEEIRNLAGSTADNAKSISETLKTLVEHIESATQLSKESGSAFQQIEDGVNRVSNAFNQINEQTTLVSNNAQEVVHSASELQKVSQHTTNSMNEMEVGAKDINGILENSRDISDLLEKSMNELTSKTQSMNLITTKISDSYLNSNKANEAIMELFSQYLKQHTGETTRDRIHIGNLILNHILWVANVRCIIDGTLSIDEFQLADSQNCDLGKWLKTAKAEEMIDGEKSRTLNLAHENLHHTLQKILTALSRGNSSETQGFYKELQDFSGQIVQILTTIGNKDFVQWSPKLSVHIEDFDKHHRVLISLINKLYTNMEQGKGSEVLTQIFQELIDYTIFHFQEEEKVMVHFQYPDLEEHVRQHEILLKKAGQLNQDFSSGKAVLSNELLDFLQDWVTNHILKVDSHYSDFFSNKDISSMVQEYQPK